MNSGMSDYEFIDLVFGSYRTKRKLGLLQSSDNQIPKNIISTYFASDCKSDFSNIISKFKKKYIFNESEIENTNSKYEKLGLGEVYDYISNFDYSINKFNIFVQSLLIHQKLYSKCPDKSFGGTLRSEQAILKGTYLDVMDAEEAKRYFNSFISNSDFIFEPLKDNDIFGYIEGCIILTVKLIKAQPFIDGNKRTFRALLNLLFKKINIPPIYIETSEKLEYKNALLKAMIDDNYEDIIKFYYYKICDSIVELDVYEKVHGIKGKSK